MGDTARKLGGREKEGEGVGTQDERVLWFKVNSNVVMGGWE